jgi:hypothetical protein
VSPTERPGVAGRAQRLGRGVRLGARRFSQLAQLIQRQSETCTALDRPDTGRRQGARGRAWWADDGAWSACGRVERAAVRNGTTPLYRGVRHTHTPGEIILANLTCMSNHIQRTSYAGWWAKTKGWNSYVGSFI